MSDPTLRIRRVAVLGGSTLILEASPEQIPSPLVIRNAIAPLL